MYSYVWYVVVFCLTGYALKRLTELLAMFLEEGGARRAYKTRLVGAVLGGYLSLRRLVVQRTRLTDDTQEKLLELLEEMTTGIYYFIIIISVKTFIAEPRHPP